MEAPLWKRLPANPGDPIQIGHEVTLIKPPRKNRARVVGLAPNRKKFKVLVRVFNPGDNGFPTGEYIWTSPRTLYPWRPDGT